MPNSINTQKRWFLKLNKDLIIALNFINLAKLKKCITIPEIRLDNCWKRLEMLRMYAQEQRIKQYCVIFILKIQVTVKTVIRPSH